MPHPCISQRLQVFVQLGKSLGVRLGSTAQVLHISAAGIEAACQASGLLTQPGLGWVLQHT